MERLCRATPRQAQLCMAARSRAFHLAGRWRESKMLLNSFLSGRSSSQAQPGQLGSAGECWRCYASTSLSGMVFREGLW